VSALWYWGVFVSIGVWLLNVTLPLWKVGSGNSRMSCERMHAAALM
jgi:hypothetical protein